LAQEVADRTRLAQVMILAEQMVKALPILGRNHFNFQDVPVVTTSATTPLDCTWSSFHQTYSSKKALDCLQQNLVTVFIEQMWTMGKDHADR
jgi:hypothetical protein